MEYEKFQCEFEIFNEEGELVACPAFFASQEDGSKIANEEVATYVGKVFMWIYQEIIGAGFVSWPVPVLPKMKPLDMLSDHCQGVLDLGILEGLISGQMPFLTNVSVNYNDARNLLISEIDYDGNNNDDAQLGKVFRHCLLYNAIEERVRATVEQVHDIQVVYEMALDEGIHEPIERLSGAIIVYLFSIANKFNIEWTGPDVKKDNQFYPGVPTKN